MEASPSIAATPGATTSPNVTAIGENMKPRKFDRVIVTAPGFYQNHRGQVSHVHGGTAMVKFSILEPETEEMRARGIEPVVRYMHVTFRFSELRPDKGST
jgi:hypothetical protein